MANFGNVKYAVLCKVREMKLNAEENGGLEGQSTHKGTGFVQFQDSAVAEQLIELSSSIELKLDEECKASRIRAKKELLKGKGNEHSSLTDNKGILSVITGELELNGRRLYTNSSNLFSSFTGNTDRKRVQIFFYGLI